MATGLYNWNRTPASNASATYNMAEGMAPSAVNDGIRGLMSDAAQWRDDISGAIATSGTPTAYTVASYQVFDSLAHMNGQMIAFSPHATNGATVTLNVDGLGAKPLRSAPSTEIVAGHLVQGTPYVAVYNSSDAAFYLQGFFGSPYSIPIGGSLDFWGSTAPNSSFVLMYGQAISRTTYATLFAMFSTGYGAGDGSTTFNVPDCRGRVNAAADGMGGSLAGRLDATSGMNGTGLGAVGGAQQITLTTAQLASHSHANTLTDPGHTHVERADTSSGAVSLRVVGTGGNGSSGSDGGVTQPSTTGITITNASAGSGSAHNNVQPTIVCNRLLRVI